MSTEYPKIHSLFKRDQKTNRFIIGEWTFPEFEYLASNDWLWTEKVDGTNIRVAWDGQSATIGGRTDNAQIPVPLYQRLSDLFLAPAQQHALATTFADTTPDAPVVLYGEGYGNKIQKHGHLYKAGGVDFVLFDVRVGGWWLRRPDVEGVAAALGVEVVPLIGHGTLHEAIAYVQQGFPSQWGAFAAEGLVARPAVELRARNGERLITKIKTRDFAS